MRVALLTVALALLVVGCVQSASVHCEDGSLCPRGYVCDLAHEQCVRKEAFAECEGAADGAACSVSGVPGLCDQQVCIAMCGDGFQNAGEECDCGRDASTLPSGCTAPNDAPLSECSETCTLRFCGNAVVDPGEVCDDANLDRTQRDPPSECAQSSSSMPAFRSS